jgi:hypothetical protein
MRHATTRRQFLRTAAGIGTASLMPAIGWAAAGSPDYLAAAGLPDGGFCLLGLTGEGAETFRIALPDRGHAAAAHPSRPQAVAFARRPGTFALVIDCARGEETARLTAPEGRHFYGHGAFSADGGTLFTTENDIASGQGRIGVWDADGYRRIGELASGGTGPHEIRLMPDGARLAVANGGIETDPASGRAELNLATMRANLAYLDAGTGAVTEVLELPEALRLNSIRHIAAGADGTLAAGLQWQGSALEAPPLLAVHRPGAAALELLAAAPEVQRRTRNYAGSVAVSDDGTRAAITAPRGGIMLIFDLRAPGEVEVVAAPDICGVAAAAGGFACSTGEGRFVAGVGGGAPREARLDRLAFDNHLVRISGPSSALTSASPL